jgi:hypothetical protein
MAIIVELYTDDDLFSDTLLYKKGSKQYQEIRY